MAPTKPVQALEDWLRSHPGGYLHPNIHIVDDDNAGVHWRACGPVEPNTRLATVPHSIALSYLNALADTEYSVFSQRRNAFKIEAIGFFYLSLQYVNRSTSFWKPYLESLPQPEERHTTPLWFDTPEDQAWLADTDALFTSKKLKAIYEDQYQSGITVLKQAGIDTAPLTWDLFRWAITMFTSRSFSSRSVTPQDSKYWTTYKTGPDGRRQTVLMDMSHVPSADLDFSVLFPAMDAANHHHTSKVDWTFDQGRFSLACTQSIQDGQEVNNNYGPKANDEFLIGYGFCMADNPNDTVLLTLKPPPEELQVSLRESYAGFFTTDGQWNGDKATFKLRRMNHEMATATSAFDDLPEPLLELLTHIIRFDRGLPFEPLPAISQYLKDPNSHGRRYLPFVARMIVTSLAPKYQKSQAGSADLPQEPQNVRQAQAKIYRDGQSEILLGTMNGLRTSLRVFRPATHEFPQSELERMNPTGSRLATLEEAVALFSQSTSGIGGFMAGVQANANTSDLEQLRLAGWEEDAWVLLLCYSWLLATSQPEESQLTQWMAELDAEYQPSLLLEPTTEKVEGEASNEAGDMMTIVKRAAAKLPGSLWEDVRWSEKLIAGFGGRVLKNESFMMMVQDSTGREEARLVMYLHSNTANGLVNKRPASIIERREHDLDANDFSTKGKNSRSRKLLKTARRAKLDADQSAS